MYLGKKHIVRIRSIFHSRAVLLRNFAIKENREQSKANGRGDGNQHIKNHRFFVCVILEVSKILPMCVEILLYNKNFQFFKHGKDSRLIRAGKGVAPAYPSKISAE